MDLNKLNYFYRVALSGSFTKAAELIHVSQPSISKMVINLEDELGEKLFLRRKAGIKLTPAGEIVFEKCRRIFSEADSIRMSLSESQTEVAGDLRIGASDNLCNYILPTVIKDFARGFPKVKIKLFSGTSKEIQSELSSERIELGLFYAREWVKAGYEAKSLSFIEFCIISSLELKLRDLNRIPFVGSRTDDYKRPYPSLDMLIDLGVNPETVLETNNQETQKRMVQEGLGYSVVPRHMVETELRDGSLFRVNTPKKIGLPVQMTKRKNRPLSRPALVFEKQLMFRLQGP